MQTPSVLAGGAAPKLVATKVVALYEPTSGRIHHLHTSHFYEGAVQPAESTLIAHAARQARRLGHDTERLSNTISENPLHGQIPHRIDTDSGAFVPLTD